LIYWFIHSLVRMSVRSLVCVFVRSIVRTFNYSYVRKFVSSYDRTVGRSEVNVRTFKRWHARSFIHSFIQLIIRSFICIILFFRSFTLSTFNNILLVVKCPMGLYYDTPSKTCKPCQIGFVSKQEGSLQCDACPTNTSTLVEGSKTCTGNSNLLIFFLVLFIYLFIIYLFIVSCFGIWWLLCIKTKSVKDK